MSVSNEKGGGAQWDTGQGERLLGAHSRGAVQSDTCMPQGLHLMYGWGGSAVTHGHVVEETSPDTQVQVRPGESQVGGKLHVTPE